MLDMLYRSFDPMQRLGKVTFANSILSGGMGLS